MVHTPPHWSVSFKIHVRGGFNGTDDMKIKHLALPPREFDFRWDSLNGVPTSSVNVDIDCDRDEEMQLLLNYSDDLVRSMREGVGEFLRGKTPDIPNREFHLMEFKDIKDVKETKITMKVRDLDIGPEHHRYLIDAEINVPWEYFGHTKVTKYINAKRAKRDVSKRNPLTWKRALKKESQLDKLYTRHINGERTRGRSPLTVNVGNLDAFKGMYNTLLEGFSQVDDFTKIDDTSKLEVNDGWEKAGRFKFKRKKKDVNTVYGLVKDAYSQIGISIDDGPANNQVKTLVDAAYKKVTSNFSNYKALNKQELQGLWRIDVAKSISTSISDGWAKAVAEEVKADDDLFSGSKDVYHALKNKQIRFRGRVKNWLPNRFGKDPRINKSPHNSTVKDIKAGEKNDKGLFKEFCKGYTVSVDGLDRTHAVEVAVGSDNKVTSVTASSIKPVFGSKYVNSYTPGLNSAGKKDAVAETVENYLKLASHNYLLGGALNQESKVKGIRSGTFKKLAGKSVYLPPVIGVPAAAAAYSTPALAFIGASVAAPLVVPIYVAGTVIGTLLGSSMVKGTKKLWDKYKSGQREGSAGERYTEIASSRAATPGPLPGPPAVVGP